MQAWQSKWLLYFVFMVPLIILDVLEKVVSKKHQQKFWLKQTRDILLLIVAGAGYALLRR